MKSILIIGLGRFGRHLCCKFMSLKNEVMIVDRDEAAVTALQFANQTINTISPVAGMTVAGLAVAKISFGQWWKTIWKFFIFMVVFGLVITAISGMLPA